MTALEIGTEVHARLAQVIAHNETARAAAAVTSLADRGTQMVEVHSDEAARLRMRELRLRIMRGLRDQARLAYQGSWFTDARRDARRDAAVYGPSAFESIYMGADYGAIETRLDARGAQRDVMAYYAALSPTDAATAYATKVDAPTRETLTHSPAVAADLDLSTPRVTLALEAAALLGYGALAKDAGVPGELRRALAKLELEVIDEKSVDAYKAQMVQHYASHQKMAMPTWRLTSLREYTQPVPEHVLAKAVSIKRELPQAEFYVDQLAVDPFLIVTLKPLKDTNVNTASRKLDPEVAAYIEVWDEPKFEEAWA